jgi:raffinose/stachyose/melibiose transport system substrate-binding protein
MEKKMRKNKLWVVITLIILFTMGLSACTQPTEEVPAVEPTEAEAPQKEEPTKAAEPTEPQEEPAEVVELVGWETATSEQYIQWWTDYVEKFNAEHPNINVTMEFFPTEAYRAKIYSALAAGEQPDFFELPNGEVGWTAFRDGKILELDNLLDTEKLTESALQSCTLDGHVICLPTWTSPIILHYNKKLFAAAGVDPQTWADPNQPTWDEFTAAADALVDSGVVPLATACGDLWPCAFHMWIGQNRFGGNAELIATSPAGDNVKYIDSPGFVKAAQMISDLGQMPYHPAGFVGISGGQKYDLFTQEIAAIAFHGSWILGRVETDAPEDFELGVFNFPSFPDGHPDHQKDVLSGYQALFPSADTEHPEELATFFNGFFEEDVAVSFLEDTQLISGVQSALDTVKGEDTYLGQMVTLLVEAPNIAMIWDTAVPTAVFEASKTNAPLLFGGEITAEEYVQLLDAAIDR